MRQIIYCVLLIATSFNEASATTRRMECRQWIDKEYRGLYSFTFDDEQASLVVSYKPKGKFLLFGQSIDTWKLLWRKDLIWPAPGSEDTELGVLMELEVGHGETKVHAGVQA